MSLLSVSGFIFALPQIWVWIQPTCGSNRIRIRDTAVLPLCMFLYGMKQSPQRAVLIIFIRNDVRFGNWSLLHSYRTKFIQAILYMDIFKLEVLLFTILLEINALTTKSWKIGTFITFTPRPFWLNSGIPTVICEYCLEYFLRVWDLAPYAN